MKRRIAIIGSGRIGGGLARAWVRTGHAVTFGARRPDAEELTALAKELGARRAGLEEAARGAEVVVLAVPFRALDEVVPALGDLRGKVVIDCTNAVGPGMTPVFGNDTSAAEVLQERLPGAYVFKSFNAQGAENLAAPRYGEERAANFYAGDDAKAAEVVHRLVEDVGFDAVNAGPLRSARLLEPLMLLWVALSRQRGTRDLAFRLLER